MPNLKHRDKNFGFSNAIKCYLTPLLGFFCSSFARFCVQSETICRQWQMGSLTGAVHDRNDSGRNQSAAPNRRK